MGSKWCSSGSTTPIFLAYSCSSEVDVYELEFNHFNIPLWCYFGWTFFTRPIFVCVRIGSICVIVCADDSGIFPALHDAATLTCIARFAPLVKNLSEDVLLRGRNRRRGLLLFLVLVVFELPGRLLSTAHASSPIPRPLSSTSMLAGIFLLPGPSCFPSKSLPLDCQFNGGRPPIQIQKQI